MNDHEPAGAGKSSFDLVDAEKLFGALPLSGKSGFLDLGCGSGAYSISLSGRIDENAVIYAVDLWAHGINEMKASIRDNGIMNIRALLSDITRRTVLSDECVDICLMATVLHDLVKDETAEGAITELVRVVKPHGELAVVEFKKIPGPPGPPEEIRLDADQVEKIVSPYGFTPIAGPLDIGPYNYLLRFMLNK